MTLGLQLADQVEAGYEPLALCTTRQTRLAFHS